MEQDKDAKSSDRKSPGDQQPGENSDPKISNNTNQSGKSGKAGPPDSGTDKAGRDETAEQETKTGSSPAENGVSITPTGSDDSSAKKPASKKSDIGRSKTVETKGAAVKKMDSEAGKPETGSIATSATGSAKVSAEAPQSGSQKPGSNEPAGADQAGSSSPTPEKTPARRRSWLRWLKWLLILTFIVGLIAGTIVVWEKYGIEYVRNVLDLPVREAPVKPVEPVVIHTPAPENWREPLSEMETRLESRLAQVAGASRGLEAGVQNELADMQVRLNSYGERIRALSTTTREDWLLAEAEYLLRLASQRLLTERQTKNALALMETADLILRDLNDPDLFPVRKVLADDITALRMAGVIDREGLYLKLDSLAGSVDQLTPLHNPEKTPAEEITPLVPESTPNWDDRLLANLQSVFQDMISLVRIQRRDVPLEPLLSVEQEMTLRYNIRVMLEQAQLAMLREEQTIYDASLAKAEEWVERLFVPNPASEAVLGELRKLRQETVVQPLPSVTGSLSALHDYIALWHNRYPVEGRETAQ